ncbi:Flagellar glycoprotein-like protein [Lotmaria passim]
MYIRHFSTVQGRQTLPAALALLAAPLLALLLSSITVAAQTADSSSNSEYYFDGSNYYYSYFRNYLASNTFPDGGNGVGRYGAVGFGAAFDSTGVVFSDMTRGSRVRKITSDGQLYTIAGSNNKTGCTDTKDGVTLFGGALYPTDINPVNAIIAASGGYYIADSQCSGLRFINATTHVTSTISLFSADNACRPTALAKTPYANTQKSNIYITDPANDNIRFLTLDAPTTAIDKATNWTGVFQPIGIALLPSISRIVATNLGRDFISLDYTTSAANSGTAKWLNLSTNTTTNPLVTSWDGLHVEYISDNVIVSMPVNSTAAAEGKAEPKVVFTFTPLSTSETATSYPEKMLLFAPRSAKSYYILTTHRYLVASATPIHPSSSTSSSSSSSSSSSGGRGNNSSSSGRGNSSNSGSGGRGNSSSSSSSSSSGGRGNNSSSSGRGNSSSSGSGGRGNSSSSSSSSGNHGNSGSSSSGGSVTPTPTATPTSTPTSTPHTSTCDGVCKGAIASSVVMACAGITLIVLMIISPANLRTAIIMVPII